MKKILLSLGFLVIVCVALLFLFKDTLVSFLLVSAVKKTTGVSVHIEQLHTAPLKGIVKIKRLQLMNPPEFPEKVLADVPELYLDMDLWAFSKGKIHIEKLVLNLGELIILRSQQGELNLSSLKPIREELPEEKNESSQDTEKQKKKWIFQLDYLVLSIGRAFYRDYRVSNSPPSREYPIGIKNA